MGSPYYGHGVVYGKREAEPEAKADPYFYNGVYGGIGHYGGVYGYPYSGVHYGVYGKREAEAEPKADAEADPAIVNTVPVVSTYGHPVVSTLGGVVGTTGVVSTYGHPIVSTAVKTVVPSVYGHGIYGVGVYGKRDAEADPYFYNGVYGGIGHYGGVYGYPSSGVHYGVYGKREAEARRVYGFPYTTGFGYAHTPYIGYGVYHG